MAFCISTCFPCMADDIILKRKRLENWHIYTLYNILTLPFPLKKSLNIVTVTQMWLSKFHKTLVHWLAALHDRNMVIIIQELKRLRWMGIKPFPRVTPKASGRTRNRPRSSEVGELYTIANQIHTGKAVVNKLPLYSQHQAQEASIFHNSTKHTWLCLSSTCTHRYYTK